MKRKWKCCTFCNESYPVCLFPQKLIHEAFHHQSTFILLLFYMYCRFRYCFCFCIPSGWWGKDDILFYGQWKEITLYKFLLFIFGTKQVWLFDAVNMISHTYIFHSTRLSYRIIASNCVHNHQAVYKRTSVFTNEFFNYIYLDIFFHVSIVMYTWLMTCIVLSCTSFLE